MTHFVRSMFMRGLPIAVTLCGLGISDVCRADGKPVTIPTANPAGSAAPAFSSAAAPLVRATDKSDPCLSGKFDERVTCVQQLSVKLAAVCTLDTEQLKQEFEAIAVEKVAKANAEAKSKANANKGNVAGVPAAAPVPPAGPGALALATDAHKIQTNVCDALCPKESNINLCHMNEIVANAATAAAWPDILAARKYIEDQLAAIQTLKAADTANANNFAILRLKQDVTQKSAQTSAVFDMDVAGAAATFLQGMSKLIVDRAKTEAVGWLLDQLGSELCGDDESMMTLAQREISTYWLPSVCTLAHGQRLSGYGGGGAILEGLRRAIESDLEHWPGTGASFAPAALYWLDIPKAERPVDSIVNCSEPKKSQSSTCRAVAAVRAATRDGVTAMLKGRAPLASLHDLSVAYRDANVEGMSFKSGKLQVAACSLGLPQDLNQIDTSMQTSLPTDSDRAHAAVLAALVTVPACFDIVKVDPRPTEPTLQQLNTIFALETQVGVWAANMWTNLKALNAATVEFGRAKEALEKASDKLLNVPPPTLSSTQESSSLLDTLTAYQAGIANGIMGPAEWRMLRAVIGVADAGVAISQSGLRLVDGGCASFKKLETCQVDLREAKSRLDELRRYIAIAGEAANGDWSKAALSVLSAARQSSPTDVSGASPARGKLLRHVGLLVAIVSARDSDGVAKALDEAAAPVGAWRGKGVPNATTVSLTAHAGLFGALELRHGTYGADYEDWSPHFQAPTLALPVGIEVAWGKDSCISPVAFFFPLIDPAAFLEYDAGRDGKLPGASIKTALSPGFGVRLGFANSPFSLIPEVVYRPGFRQWDSKFSGTGADALQFGLLLAVDVTLLELSRSEKNP